MRGKRHGDEERKKKDDKVVMGGDEEEDSEEEKPCSFAVDSASFVPIHALLHSLDDDARATGGGARGDGAAGCGGKRVERRG